MASTQPTPSETKQEQSCPSCGQPMAADQRYCLNCGARRGDPRVEFQRHLFAGDSASENGLARAPAGRGWNPLAAAALLGLLGIMLLVGVLIGKDESDDPAPSTTPPAQTTPSAGGAAAPTAPPAATTPTTPSVPPATTTPGAGFGAGGGAQSGAPESELGVPPQTKPGARP